jgi:hypothetical protein
MRKHGSDRSGGSFSEATIEAVWNKGIVVAGADPKVHRKDVCGALIQRNLHGDTKENGYGWDIDHKKPVVKGGADDLDNLQPLQWQNNRHKGDDHPNWSCLVKSKN